MPVLSWSVPAQSRVSPEFKRGVDEGVEDVLRKGEGLRITGRVGYPPHPFFFPSTPSSRVTAEPTTTECRMLISVAPP